jgi:hypothetical protein
MRCAAPLHSVTLLNPGWLHEALQSWLPSIAVFMCSCYVGVVAWLGLPVSSCLKFGRGSLLWKVLTRSFGLAFCLDVTAVYNPVEHGRNFSCTIMHPSHALASFALLFVRACSLASTSISAAAAAAGRCGARPAS